MLQDLGQRIIVKDYAEAVRRIEGMKQNLRQGYFMHHGPEYLSPVQLTSDDREHLKVEIAKIQRDERRLAKMLSIF